MADSHSEHSKHSERSEHSEYSEHVRNYALLILLVAPFLLLLFLFNAFPTTTGSYLFYQGDNLPSIFLATLIALIVLAFFFGILR
jgi:hypothetical protein